MKRKSIICFVFLFTISTAYAAPLVIPINKPLHLIKGEYPRSICKNLANLKKLVLVAGYYPYSRAGQVVQDDILDGELLVSIDQPQGSDELHVRVDANCTFRARTVGAYPGETNSVNQNSIATLHRWTEPLQDGGHSDVITLPAFDLKKAIPVQSTTFPAK